MDYPTAVRHLGDAVRLAVRHGFDRDAAIDLVCGNAIKDSQQAASRSGNWAYESTTEQIERALFMGQVARDATSGAVARPSVGNVREAIRAASLTDA